MALATQCPHCHTTFRVAHDQLKLRSGMVRCGSCQHIFNGIEHLAATQGSPAPIEASKKSPDTDDTDVSTASTSLPHAPAPIAPTHTGLSPESRIVHLAPSVPDESDSLDFALDPLSFDSASRSKTPASSSEVHTFNAQPPSLPVAAEPDLADRNEELEEAASFPPSSFLINKALLNTETTEAEDAVFEEAEFSTDLAVSEDPLWDQAISMSEARIEEYPPVFGLSDEPDFVKHGRRKQSHKRAMRIALWLSIFFFSVSLFVQSTYIFRDLIAAWYPPSKPFLMQECEWIGCQIGLPMQIDTLTIEPNDRALLSLDKNKTIYEFNVLLHNHSTLPQAWPYIELTLNEASGQAVMRRIFKPSDFPLPASDIAKGIAPESEQSVRFFFRLSQIQAAGYTVKVFYP